jgi:hypothetical protein
VTTPADELRTAAAKMRTFPGPAAEPMAKLLEQAAKHHDDGFLCCDQGPEACSEVVAPALAVARAINAGGQP